MPSPEQGASTSTRSKKPLSLSASSGTGAWEITALRTPMRSMFDNSTWQRLRTTSLLHKSPFPCKRAAIWVDLPPGAAHTSRIFSPGCGSNTVTALDAEGSWE